MNFRYLFSVITIFFLTVSLKAQQFGGNPPSIKWKQINTDTVRVIFPAGLEEQAQRITGIAHDLSHKTQRSIGNRVRKIDIVLQNETVVSNGYVGLGPYRSEFQLTPDPNSFNLGSLPWAQSLAIHEYRHVQQFNNFRRGLAAGFYFLFGEEGQALSNSLTVPDWFFEGDAVYQETQVSKQGRGRLPFFFNPYHSLWSTGKKYSWMKLRNGSFRDFVPDHYRLGYMLVAYGREKYGEEFWKKVVTDAAAWRGLFYPLQKAIRKYSGKSFKEFREEAFRFFDTTTRTPVELPKKFVNYEYPYWIDSSSVVYLKWSYSENPAFVVQSGKTETKIRTRDVSADNYYSYNNGKIVYAAYRPDRRWGWRDYSELKILNVRTGDQKRLVSRTKYFSPDVSTDGNVIIAVHMDRAGNSSLHLVNAVDGSVRKILQNDGGWFYTYPKFYQNDKIVTAVRDKEGKMSIAIIQLANDSVRLILPFSWTVVGFPSVDSNSIYFTASYNGRDKIFRWEEGQIYMANETGINPHNTGDYQLHALHNRFVWSRFTAGGYQLMFAKKNLPAETIISPEEFLHNESTFGIQSIKDSLNNFLSGEQRSIFPVTNYSKSFRLFNFHSRRPYINDPDFSFAFVSENILNTLQSEIYASYNRNEKFKQVGFSGVFAGSFPLLKFSTQYTIDRNARIRNNAPRTYWNEWETSVGTAVPLNLSQGKFFRYLTVATDYVYNKRYFTGYYKDSFENRAFGYLNAGVNFSNQIQRARQHINPRFAQSIVMNYKRAMTRLDGNQLLASGNLYFPGLFVNHSIVLQVAWQKRDTLNEIRFSNSFPFSRGYATNNFYRMWKLGGNYHLPLFYPDWGLGNIVYFLRIRANLFYDYSEVADYTTSRQLTTLRYRSFGSEIFFDTRWWNQLPISFGFRYSRLLDTDIERRGPNQFQFILPVNLLSR